MNKLKEASAQQHLEIEKDNLAARIMSHAPSGRNNGN